MTIFDVLRYDISRPPSRSQLDAIPDDIYLQWCKAIGIDIDTITIERSFMYSILNIQDVDTNALLSNTKIYEALTKILTEYKDDNLR